MVIKSAIALYFFVIVLFLFDLRLQIRFTYLFPIILPFLFYLKKNFSALFDWTPFYLAIFLYDGMRGLADNLSSRVSLIPLHMEEFVFGEQIPNIVFQEKLIFFLEPIPSSFLTLFYLSHYLIPILFLIYFWHKDIKVFRFCTMAIFILMALAVLSFIALPAAPPWMAVGGVERITPLMLDSMFGLRESFYSLDSNPLAPFPSLHAAYPFLFYLLSRRFFPQLSKIFLGIFLVVSFTLVLFGEHYVVDLFAGAL